MSSNQTISLAAAVRLLRVLILALTAAAALWLPIGIAAVASDDLSMVPISASAQTRTKSAAAVQLDAGEFTAAIELAERDIARFNKMHNRYDIQLAQPLQVVGDARLGLGDAAGALRAYQRATQILRVNHGLTSATQVEGLLAEVRAHIELGELSHANHRLEYAHALTLRAYGQQDPKILPITVKLAGWYRFHYQMDAARALYERALALSDIQPSTTAQQRIWLVRQIASTYRATRFPTSGPTSIRPGLACCGRQYEYNRRYGRAQSEAEDARAAETALLRAVAIIRSDAQVNSSVRTEVMLELADWYLLLDLQSAAKRVYAALWSLLTPDERRAVFAKPMQLYIPHPGNPQLITTPGRVTANQSSEGSIEFELDVGPRGRVIGHPRQRQVSPADLVGIKYQRAAGYAIYRPALVAGVPVRSDNVRLAYGFNLTPDN